jgi:hypothetical protein
MIRSISAIRKAVLGRDQLYIVTSALQGLRGQVEQEVLRRPLWQALPEPASLKALRWDPMLRNSSLGRVYYAQRPANNPIEDRLDYRDMPFKQGFFSAVFDGHGGAEMAEFAS